MKNKHPALTNVTALTSYLKEKLPHRRIDALQRIAEVIFGIIASESSRHRKIAAHIDRNATPASKARMVARTFHDAELTEQDVLDILLPLLPKGRLVFAMDRTNWKYGQTHLNILVLGVVVAGCVLPLVREVIEHSGNSCAQTRIKLVSHLLKAIPAHRWQVLIADREFVGKAWFQFLRRKKIKRCIRIKETTRMDELLARDNFKNLEPGQVRGLQEKAYVYGSFMQVVATLSPEGERVIVASDLPIWKTLEVYRWRWSIECTFSGMKSRGLGLEETHMIAPERIGRLFGLLSIAYVWTLRIGEWRAADHPIPVKKHGRKALSLAQYGWEVLVEAINFGKSTFQTYLTLLKTPFPPLERQKT